jgi:hypothetical protein
MAVTGTISISPSGAAQNGKVTVTLTLSNDSTDVYLAACTPTLTCSTGIAQPQTALGNVGSVPMLPGTTLIPASATLVKSWDVVVFSDAQIDPPDYCFNVMFAGANCTIWDGATTFTTLVPTAQPLCGTSQPNVMTGGIMRFDKQGDKTWLLGLL